MSTSELTLRDVLPSDMTGYSENVLNTTLKEAQDIAIYGLSGKPPLTKEDEDQIKEIYSIYLKDGGSNSNSDSAYWKKSQSENEAYWKKDE